MLVDDNAVVRYGFATYLTHTPEFTLVAEVENGEEAIRACQSVKPDVILMDLHMPVMDGIAATNVITQHYPEVAVLMLTTAADESLVQQAYAAGAAGYLHKSTEGDQLGRTIRQLHMAKRGCTVAPSPSAAIKRKSSVQLKVALTEKELDLLQALMKGWSNQQIANDFVETGAAVGLQVSTLLAKLHAHSRTEAIVIALRYNLLNRLI
jgi:DNA-binding NarL/FixJ family response regulator